MQYADNREVDAAVWERFPPKPISVEFLDEYGYTTEKKTDKKRHPKNKQNEIVIIISMRYIIQWYFNEFKRVIALFAKNQNFI